MEYKFKAHPTMYKNTLFRSRLEARWAAFFDLIDWNWEYEPIDLNGWVPDFVVRGTSSEPMFVEIKPLFIGDPEKTDASILNKISNAIKPAEALLIGLAPIYPTELHEGLGIGLIAEGGEWWQQASFCHGTIEEGIGVVPAYGSYASRISSDRGGDSGSPAVPMKRRGEMRDCDRESSAVFDHIMWSWMESGNITRWTPE